MQELAQQVANLPILYCYAKRAALVIALAICLQACGITPAAQQLDTSVINVNAASTQLVAKQLDAEILDIGFAGNLAETVKQEKVAKGNVKKNLRAVTPSNHDEPIQHVEGAPDELWSAIAPKMSLASIEDNPRIASEKSRYLKMRYHLRRTAERSRPYLHYIASEINKRQLPMDLALLPAIESAFDPYAYSSGHASGLWQFIPGTAQWLGMQSSWWYDDRRDVITSTHTALDYLTDLNRRFKGDWLHTLAAYNAGARTVHRAIAMNKRLGKPTDFWSLKLPQETQHYVPRLLALTKIIQEREALALDLPNIPNEPYFAEVETDGQFELAHAAELAGISTREFYRLNAGFSRQASAPEATHRILLPVNAVPRFVGQRGTLTQRTAGKWLRYEVGTSDNLNVLAMRFGTDVSFIKTTNGLRNGLLKPGQTLLIKHETDTPSLRLAANTTVSPPQVNTLRIVHAVAEGESLASIAKHYDLPAGTVARWNGIGIGMALPAGKKLTIWLAQTREVAQVDSSNAQTGIAI